MHVAASRALFGLLLLLSSATLAAPAPPQADETLAEMSRALSEAMDAGARHDRLLELTGAVPLSVMGGEEYRKLLEDAVTHPDARRAFPTLFARLQGAHESVADHSGLLAAAERIRRSLAPLSPVEGAYLAYREARARLSAGATGESLDGYRAVIATIDGWSEPSRYMEAHGRYVRSLATEELVLALLEEGLVDAARRLESLERDRLPGLLSEEIALESGRYAAVLTSLGEPSDEDAALSDNARLLRGCALARLDRLAEARSDLESVASSEDATPIVRASAELALVEVCLRGGQVDAAAAALQRLDEGPELPALARARRDGLRVRWCSRASAPAARRAAALATLRASYAEWVQAWQDAPILASGAHFLRPVRRSSLVGDVIDAELASEGGATAALQRVIEAQACGTLARRMELGACSVQALREHLSATGGGVLVFVPVPEVTHVFAVDAEGVMHATAPAAAEIRERSSALAGWLRAERDAAAGEFDPERLAGAWTASMIPAPIAVRSRDWKCLRFVGLDDVVSLPPTLLRFEGRTWLGAEIEVAEWPSVVVGLALEAPAASRMDGVVAIIDPAVKGREDLARLPFDAEELQALRRAAPDRVRIAEGELAVPDRMLDASGALLYVHGHGESDPRLDRPGVLLLAGPSGSLDAARIESMFAGRRAPLDVVLAACDAGRSRLRFGEDGADHLGAAFLLSGARSCVLPLRKAYHEPAKEFALRYVSGRLAGEEPAAAALAARVAMVERGTDPRDAVALRLIGAARGLVRRAAPR